jgi:hypothetical protein
MRALFCIKAKYEIAKAQKRTKNTLLFCVTAFGAHLCAIKE